jgi:hypothetical protein
MALWKTAGPEGLHQVHQPIDDGTLARMFSPTPGPIGLYVHPKGQAQSAPVAASPKFGIRINEASKISAGDWVAKINSSNDVDDYFKPQIKSQDRLIFLTDPKKFVYPKNVIEKIWLKDWLSAFMFADWEMTTGSLDMSVSKGDAQGPIIKTVHTADLSTGDSLDGFTQHTMTGTFRSSQAATIEMGITLPDGATLASKRTKLIVITNRIVLTLADKPKKTFNVDDPELLGTWFHEIACHAGENSEGIPDIHGDPHVELCAKDIDAMFPKSPILTQVFAEADNFLKSSPPVKAAPPAKKPGKP